ncbi:hypothetical protein [Streptomyces sp. NRRL S-1868]|uniref:hypothetical protein n=1 Tax=Streptomyces sp. NRRL S-1868 TaxID=1463892 RepID=UPI0004C8A72B|nr:hypothetical protein [Streptomyces sp. NRRL S-1868]
MTVVPAVAVEEPEKPESPLTCFVIGPIGNRHAPVDSPALRAYEESLEVFEKVILPACAHFGVAAVRADRINESGDINEQVIRHVLLDDIVIADVSGGNPNVMYELGVRHVRRKATIHIGEHGRLPFDISPIRTIQFVRSRSGLIDARKDLEGALGEGLRNGFQPLAPARILRGLSLADEDVPDEDGTEGEEEAPGLIDRFARVEERMGEMTQDMDAIAASLAVITARTEESGPAMERASRPGSPVSAGLGVMSRYAASIKEPAAELKEHAARFAGQLAELDGAVRAALDFIQSTPPQERGADAKEFLAQLVGTSESAREGMEGLTYFGGMVQGLAGLSRDMRGPGKDISSAVQQVSKAMASIEQWEERARRLM